MHIAQTSKLLASHATVPYLNICRAATPIFVPNILMLVKRTDANKDGQVGRWRKNLYCLGCLSEILMLQFLIKYENLHS